MPLKWGYHFSLGDSLKRSALVATAVAAVLLSGCSQTPPPVSEKVQQYYDENVANRKVTLTPAPAVLTFSAVGDSVTLGDSKNFGAGTTGPLSWVTYAVSPQRKFTGGFGSAGSTTQSMLERVQPSKAEVVVIMAGTNDTSQGVPFEQSAANIAGLVRGLAAGKVVVSAIPPSDKKPAEAKAYNASLEPFVKQQGWTWVDPWVSVRDNATGRWLPGLTSDAIHPVQSASEVAGKAIGEAIGAK